MDAREIVAALGGRWSGRSGMACCPAHDDRTPSLSVAERDGVVLVRCFAGCTQNEVIDALRQRGLWPAADGNERATLPRGQHRRPAARPPDRDALARSEAARRIWREGQKIVGTVVERYLIGRGLSGPWSPALRYHPALRHRPSERVLPAMVAAVTISPARRLVGIHRTFLSSDGRKADIEPVKMTLGPCAGGAVHLAVAGAELGVAEGIETGLAAMGGTGIPTWAALSTSGMRAVLLPTATVRVVIFADADDAGLAAADDLARRLAREGRRVRIAAPPDGEDFNDTLRRGAA